MFDDKGSTLIGVFGLAPIHNFDDPIRGCLAAIDIREENIVWDIILAVLF